MYKIVSEKKAVDMYLPKGNGLLVRGNDLINRRNGLLIRWNRVLTRKWITNQRERFHKQETDNYYDGTIQ